MSARPVDVERGGAPRGLSRDARIRRERVQSSTRRIVPTRSRRTSPRAHRTARRSARVFHFTGVFGRGSGSMRAGDGRRVRRRSTSRCALRLDGCARKTRDTRRPRRDAPSRPSRASNRDSPPIPRFRVSPVCEAREKSHHALREVYRHPDASTRGARPLVRIHLNALRHTTQRADRCTPSSYSNDTQVEEPPLAPSTRCPSRAPSAR